MSEDLKTLLFVVMFVAFGIWWNLQNTVTP